MRFYFRPLPGLTVLTAIFLAILLSLGTWQYQRLQWKTALLEEIEAAANAAPWQALSTVSNALEKGAPVDFHRIEFKAIYQANIKPFHVYKPTKPGISWYQFVPAQTSFGGMEGVFVNIGAIKDTDKIKSAILPAGFVTIAGYVRKSRNPGWLTPESSLEENRWFGFNPDPDTYNWAEISPGIRTDYYIDASDGADSAADLPPKQPDIANNHLDYMLTWYSFALIWLIIYFILHKRRGRFGRKAVL